MSIRNLQATGELALFDTAVLSKRVAGVFSNKKKEGFGLTFLNELLEKKSKLTSAQLKSKQNVEHLKLELIKLINASEKENSIIQAREAYLNCKKILSEYAS